MHFRPVSMISHFEESSIIGTLLMSGSLATNFRNVSIAAWESSMPSSMLMSMIWAPASTCCLATSSASSKFSSLINRAKRAEPVTLVLSPTFTNRDSGVIVKASRPLNLQAGVMVGALRGATPFVTLASSAMCAGVVPQHPPTMLTNPE